MAGRCTDPRGGRALSGSRMPPTITGYNVGMRIGNTEIRPLGGGLGCLLMILVSIVLSVTLTVLLNVVVR
jgi:hypothetical protein